MRTQDDASHTHPEWLRVRREARQAIALAGISGRLPTTVSEPISATDSKEPSGEIKTPGFIEGMRYETSSIRGTLKRASQSILSLFLSSEHLIFINQSLLEVKRQFIRLHETSHGVLPCRRPICLEVEDAKNESNFGSANIFERKAISFTSEGLFQFGLFSAGLAEVDFRKCAPPNGAKSLRASIYSCMRQYDSKSQRECSATVLDLLSSSQIGIGVGCRCHVQTASFTNHFRAMHCPDRFSPDGQITQLTLIGRRRASGVQRLRVRDRDDESVSDQIETLSIGYNAIVLTFTDNSARSFLILRTILT